MKKIILFIFIISLNLFAKAMDNYEKIQSFSAVITESSNINNQKRVKEYKVLALLPNQLRKEMISPAINKGEVYLYNGDNKTIYYPLLEQTIDQKVDANENYTLKFIEDLKNSNSNNGDFKVVESNGKVKKIIYTDGVTIEFIKLTTIDNIDFPTHIKVYDKSMEISDLLLENIKLNIPVSKKDLSIDETIKN